MLDLVGGRATYTTSLASTVSATVVMSAIARLLYATRRHVETTMTTRSYDRPVPTDVLSGPASCDSSVPVISVPRSTNVSRHSEAFLRALTVSSTSKVSLRSSVGSEHTS